MSAASILCRALSFALCLGSIGCAGAPGHPGPDPEVLRPEQVMDFASLYKQNCAGCHGEDGKNGAAISLANPVYLAVAGGAAVRKVTANGVAGKLMPAFAKSAGGGLTDQQIDSLVQGILQTWSRSDVLGGLHAPSYAAGAKGDPAQGQKSFAEFCARCHGPDGKGAVGQASIVDPTYLELVSEQSLRSTIIAGRPENGMPDWRSGPRTMTDQEITDVVAWLAAQRPK